MRVRKWPAIWSDWGANATDYDAFVYDDAAATVEKTRSEAAPGAGPPPLERLNSTYSCNAGRRTTLR